MAWTTTTPLFQFHLPPSSLFTFPKPTLPKPFFSTLPNRPLHFPHPTPPNPSKPLICTAAEYKFPDPIPEFAVAETEKFRAHLLKKLSKKEIYGDTVEEVVGICTEIFNTFMHTEYGGPGTLMVVPFIDMSDTLNERGFPGGPQAARAAVKWAQLHVDKDWNHWTGDDVYHDQEDMQPET